MNKRETLNLNMLNIEVYAEEDDIFLQDIAKELGLPLVNRPTNNIDYRLMRRNEKLCLEGGIDGGEVTICVDFSSGESSYRREQGAGKKQPIARAIGLSKPSNKKQIRNECINVLDATAGLGGDAFVIACLGCNVKMLERSPIIAALLNDGLQRGRQDENIQSVINRMSLYHIESEAYFTQVKDAPDVIYLDPMYPARKKSAKVKKEMQILQGLLAHSVHEDNDVLLKGAMRMAKNRVVVKRPKGAEYLNDLAPNHSIESKKTRYDVYLCSI